MKFILILTLSIAMIGVMVPDALGKTYVGEVVPYKSGEPYGFSIDYPNDWVIYDEVIDVIPELEEPPDRGDLDIMGVLDSEYFFS